MITNVGKPNVTNHPFMDYYVDPASVLTALSVAPGRSLFGERHAPADFEGLLPQHHPAQVGLHGPQPWMKHIHEP